MRTVVMDQQFKKGCEIILATQGYPKRGEIYYVSPSYTETTTEIWSGRPAIIVSNNQNNKFSNNVMVVYLTTKPKGNYPTNVPINATGKPSTALCDQVNTVAKERLGENYHVCSTKEMENVDAGLKAAFGLDFITSEPTTVSTQAFMGISESEYLRLQTERDVYKQLYQDLMQQTLSGMFAASK